MVTAPRAPARSPDSVAHAGAQVQLVFTISRCADVHNAPVPAPVKDQVKDARVELSNRQTVPLGSPLNDGCGVTASWQSLPLRDEHVGPVIALLPGWGNLRVTSQLPNAFHRGQTLHFTITVKDVADTPFRLSPCPKDTCSPTPCRRPTSADTSPAPARIPDTVVRRGHRLSPPLPSGPTSSPIMDFPAALVADRGGYTVPSASDAVGTVPTGTDPASRPAGSPMPAAMDDREA